MAAVFGFRLPKDLREYLEKQAAVNRTSIGHYIVMLIDKDMKQKENGSESVKNRVLKQGTT